GFGEAAGTGQEHARLVAGVGMVRPELKHLLIGHLRVAWLAEGVACQSVEVPDVGIRRVSLQCEPIAVRRRVQVAGLMAGPTVRDRFGSGDHWNSFGWAAAESPGRPRSGLLPSSMAQPAGGMQEQGARRCRPRKLPRSSFPYCRA